MPKRKAVTKLSGLVGSDDEDLMQMGHAEAPQESREEPPAKKPRGRPRTSNDNTTEPKTTQTKKRGSAAAASAGTENAGTRKTGRRGRPRGSSRATESVEPRASITQESYEQENEDPEAVETTKATRTGRSTTKTAKSAPAPARRGRGARTVSTAASAQVNEEFEYTPNTARQVATEQQAPRETEPSPRPRGAQRSKKDAVVEEATSEVVDESILPDDAIESAPFPMGAGSPVVKNAQARINALRNQDLSPRKRKSGVGSDGGDPDLRRKIGDLTKKHDALESRYRNLREIGIVEASSNTEKLRKQCETITAASNDLVASLKAELEAQRALAQQSRGLQKQLKEQDSEMARLRLQSDESRHQLVTAQSEIKALQTKLAAARNTATTLDNTVKAPGSAIKGGAANRANAAATAEAAQAAQIAQLKEDLFSDLTGLIVRDVKTRESDYLYDCIQTGVNGSLHFKLAVPKESSADFDAAEFQYLPLLDANRDRELLNILPEFLSVDITFARQQASKFYTRVIDALTKRRISSTS